MADEYADLKQMLQQQLKVMEAVTVKLSNSSMVQSSAAGGSQSVDHIAGSITEFLYDPQAHITFDSSYKRYEDLFSVDLAAQDDAWKVRLLLRKLGPTEHERYANFILPKNLREITFKETVQTLSQIFDNPRSNRPERRTALDARELARYKVDIAALSQTRFSEQGQLEEVGAGYTFFWSGRPRAERRDAGVVFVIRNEIVGRLPCLSQGINDRLMSLRLSLWGGKFATIISAYAPTMTNPETRASRRRSPSSDTLKSSLKRLQINPTNWEELALDRPTWRKKVKTGAAIYEANRIAAVKAKREARKAQLRPVRNAAAQPLPTCPRCQRTFRARIGLVGHLQTNWASRTAPTIVPPPASSSSSPPPTNSDNSSDPPLPSSSSSSSPTAPTAAAQATVPRTTTDITTTSPDSSDEDQDYTCPHCDRTFASHIGLVVANPSHRDWRTSA
nr:unnamed protein product [Spirometra erinaceieuropaei]